MTKTTKKQLIEEYIQKAEELKQQAKQLQARTISETREEYHKVKIDPHLSPEGKHFENEAIRQFYAERFYVKWMSSELNMISMSQTLKVRTRSRFNAD